MDEFLASLTATEVIALAAILATLIAAIVGALITLAGVLISESRAEKRHKEETARQDRIHRENLEREDRRHQDNLRREDQLRFLNERRRAYAYFANGCIQISIATAAVRDPIDTISQDLIQGTHVYYQEIVFMARHDIAQAASDLWDIVAKIAATPMAYESLSLAFKARMKDFEDLARDDVAVGSTEVSEEATAGGTA